MLKASVESKRVHPCWHGQVHELVRLNEAAIVKGELWVGTADESAMMKFIRSVIQKNTMSVVGKGSLLQMTSMHDVPLVSCMIQLMPQ